MTRIHLDTDIGSDTDDLCALAMLLGWPDAELVGITTSTDVGGQRHGYVRYALEVAGREDIPSEAGADGSIAGLFSPLLFPDYWPKPIAPRRSRPGAAIDLLLANAETGATIVAIGPFTNLAILEAARPGLLASVPVVVMGGHHTSPRDGMPAWGMRDDFNVQQDAVAARVVFERCAPIDVPLAATLEVTLRREHLEPLRASGPLGRLIADQAERHADDNGRGELAAAYSALPPDLLNFHYDPLACAVALGWDGVRIEAVGCALDHEPDGLLRMTASADAPPLETVVAVDADRFEAGWLDAVVHASERAR